MSRAPTAKAADLFPDAANANRGVFYRNGQARTVAQLYADLGATGGVQDVTLGSRAASDPGEGAFAAYAGASRTERQREQAMLVDFLLNRPDGLGALGASAPTDGAASSGGAAAGSMFSAQLLSILAQARGEAAERAR